MLKQEQIDFFDRNGYLVVEDVLDQDTVIAPLRAEYAALLDQLYAEWYAEGRVETPPDGLTFEDKLLVSYQAGCDWFQPFDISLPGERIFADTPFHFGRAAFDLVTDSRLLDAVEMVIGPEITSNPIQHIRIKPPSTNLAKDEVRSHITSTDWHQDRGVTLEEADATTMVTCWCAITDATVANGCLQVIPGAHREGLKPHCPRTQLALADNQVDVTQAVPLPVRSGDIVMFHPLTPHGSLINTTDGFRWSFDLRFNVTGEPTGRDHFPSFVARSRSHPDSELRSADRWRESWEEARARLAAKTHVEIHRWSADAPACA